MRIAVASGEGDFRKTILATNLAAANVLVTKISRRLLSGVEMSSTPSHRTFPGSHQTYLGPPRQPQMTPEREEQASEDCSHYR
jgi:hypothetical protein